jgi:flagellar hook-basal body complex protein FliE
MMPAYGAGAMAPAADPTSGAGAITPQELQKLTLPDGAQPAGLAAPGGDGSSFAGLLGRMVNEVNAKQMAAGDAVRGLQSGQNVSLHQAVIAMEEASVSFQLMVEVRNKLLESYQELMRMQI